VESVRPGLWSIPVPIPDNPLRYVLVYALEIGSSIALVDAGWPTEESWLALTEGLHVLGASVHDVRHVLVTHAHHDHHGLSARVRAASGAVVGMHEADAAGLRTLRDDPGSRSRYMSAWSVARGATATEALSLADVSASLMTLPALEAPDVHIRDGDLPLGARGGLRAIWTPGHTPGHLCFLHEEHGVLLTGDHVLPRISPNISLHGHEVADPLGDYLSSLEKVASHDVAEVLPAHEYRFRGLRGRTQQLIAHHTHRLSEIVAVLADHPGVSTWDVAARLTWSRSWPEIVGHMRWTAVSETLAHLAHLAERGCARNGGAEVDSWFLTPEV
jgi:glyoxylase-like metal-dependent hydrolase (beta-lactamase superfamily II)